MCNIECFQGLVAGIIKQAVLDYKLAFRDLVNKPKDKRAKSILKDCDDFFLGDWLKTISDVDGKTLLNNLRKICKEKYIKNNIEKVNVEKAA